MKTMHPWEALVPMKLGWITMPGFHQESCSGQSGVCKIDPFLSQLTLGQKRKRNPVGPDEPQLAHGPGARRTRNGQSLNRRRRHSLEAFAEATD